MITLLHWHLAFFIVLNECIAFDLSEDTLIQSNPLGLDASRWSPIFHGCSGRQTEGGALLAPKLGQAVLPRICQCARRLWGSSTCEDMSVWESLIDTIINDWHVRLLNDNSMLSVEFSVHYIMKLNVSTLCGNVSFMSYLFIQILNYYDLIRKQSFLRG